MCLAEVYHLFSAAEHLEEVGIPPGCVDSKVWIEHIGSELKSDLIVASTGCAVC